MQTKQATSRKLNKALARKVLEIVDAGLVHGVGVPEPGKMCVEAAVCFALGEPHGDRPSCVGAAVRAYKIRLNDANWSSDAARTAGMREIAIAQLGSNELDQNEFRSRIVVKVVQRILPIALRSVARLFPTHVEALELASVACEAALDLATARTAAQSAKGVASRTRAAAAYAYAYAAAYAAYAAAYAADAAAAYVDADAAAAYAADAADAADAGKRDYVLGQAAVIGVEVLTEMKCQGVKWLELCRE